MNITQITSIYNEQAETPIKKWHKSKSALVDQLESFTTAQAARALGMNPKVAREKLRRHAKANNLSVSHTHSIHELSQIEVILAA